MLSNELSELPNNRAILLDNITCPYCGCALNCNSENTKEHVIGRNFVPKGTLNGSWNLIVRACKSCNSTKSDLENDISAITLAGKIWFESHGSEDVAIHEANRKSKKSISRKTGKPVIESHEKLNIDIPISSGISMKFKMTSPPQIEDERVYELARLQMMAFFYFITYNKKTRKGGFWLHGFHPLSIAHHGDWGNELQMSFMKAVVGWEPRWLGCAAEGYFKSIIRRHPSSECWAWAIEWNKNHRTVGFFGSRETAQILVDTFTFPAMSTISASSNSKLSSRIDVKIKKEDDLLFEYKRENT